MPSYIAVARTLLEALAQDARTALAGGVAVAAHGYVRGTRDVDILVAVPLEQAQRRLAAHGIATVLRKGDRLEGDFSCLKGTLAGIPFDVIPQLVPIEWERVVTVRVGDATLRVIDLEALLALKLRAGAPKDLLDAAMLTLMHPESRETALNLAARYRQRERLEGLLEDPRNRAAAQESVSRPTGLAALGAATPTDDPPEG